MTDQAVPSVVGCHTTLKPGAALLDKILFVADKVEWDGRGVSPYREAMLRALASSLDGAACSYLHASWKGRESLKVPHPWVVSAHRDLCDRGPFLERVAPG